MEAINIREIELEEDAVLGLRILEQGTFTENEDFNSVRPWLEAYREKPYTDLEWAAVKMEMETLQIEVFN